MVVDVFFVRLTRGIGRHVVGVIPIALGVVDSEWHAGLLAGVGEFFQVVPPERGVGHLEIRLRRVPQVKSIMVLGDDDDVFEAPGLRDVHPLFGIEFFDFKILRISLPNLVRNRAGTAIRRLARLAGSPREVRVVMRRKAKMNEHSILGIAEPLEGRGRGEVAGVPLGLGEWLNEFARRVRLRVAFSVRPLRVSGGEQESACEGREEQLFHLMRHGDNWRAAFIQLR